MSGIAVSNSNRKTMLEEVAGDVKHSILKMIQPASYTKAPEKTPETGELGQMVNDLFKGAVTALAAASNPIAAAQLSAGKKSGLDALVLPDKNGKVNETKIVTLESRAARGGTSAAVELPKLKAKGV